MYKRQAYLERGGDYGYFADERIPGFYHGTGDVFASALVAAYVRGMSMSCLLYTSHFLITHIITQAAVGTVCSRRERRFFTLQNTSSAQL